MDVKSADDFHEKKQPMLGGFPPGFPGPMGAGLPVVGMVGAPGLQKPNPYAIPEAKQKSTGDTEITFKYPRSKIFVGGLDFKL